MARDAATITRTFTNYVQTFQTLDPHATVPYCHVPCMFISPQGVRVLANGAEVEALFTQVMENLKARSYARSELADLRVKQMSEDTALVSVCRVRYNTNGQALERFGGTYMLRNSEDNWKIAVAMIHDPDTTLRLE